MTARHGRRVAARFGSATSEAAVCLSTVGIADRFDRSTFELRGAPGDVDLALTALVALPSRTWFTRVTPRSATVRCEGGDAPACRDALAALAGTTLVEHDDDLAAIGVIGPRAEELLRAGGLRGVERPAIVVRERADSFEVLVPADQGPALFESLLELGAGYRIACVGLDALEHLAVSRRLRGVEG
jgi:hypothetical protein